MQAFFGGGWGKGNGGGGGWQMVEIIRTAKKKKEKKHLNLGMVVNNQNRETNTTKPTVPQTQQ